jgi:hypothetical protein
VVFHSEFLITISGGGNLRWWTLALTKTSHPVSPNVCHQPHPHGQQYRPISPLAAASYPQELKPADEDDRATRMAERAPDEDGVERASSPLIIELILVQKNKWAEHIR